MSRVLDALRKGGHIFDFDPAGTGRLQSRPAIPPSEVGFQKLDPKINPNARLVFRTEPAGLAAEQYRLLCRKLSARFPETAALLLTSAAPGDGKTLNAVNLAWSLAEKGESTLLVEADLRRPSMSRLFGCRPAQGIESVLRGEAEPEAVVRVLGNTRLHIAMVQKPDSNPAGVFHSPSTRRFMEWARRKFRWVVVDAPPVLPAADVSELCSLVSAALLVVRPRNTPRQLITKAVEALGDRLLGVILNEATLCFDSYYRYMSRYYESYGQTRQSQTSISTL